jgi:ABC-type maltose transport system permease subunit
MQTASEKHLTVPRKPPARRYDKIFFDVLSFETIPFLEQVSFAVLAGAAFALRKKAAAHKRLILLATIVMTAAAFSRFRVHVSDNEKFAVYAIYLLLGLMVLYDLWSLHRMHGATPIGVLLILVYLNFAPRIGHTAAWHQFAFWMQSFNL